MDHQSLTVLIPLTSGRARADVYQEEEGSDEEVTMDEVSFTGGGTAFWRQDARGPRVEGATIVMRPRAGSAMLFGGKVNHAGVPVESGQRVVLVASFSRRTSGGREQRVRDAEQARDIYGDYV